LEIGKLLQIIVIASYPGRLSLTILIIFIIHAYNFFPYAAERLFGDGNQAAVLGRTFCQTHHGGKDKEGFALNFFLAAHATGILSTLQ
jgi:hypothetical protein